MFCSVYGSHVIVPLQLHFLMKTYAVGVWWKRIEKVSMLVYRFDDPSIFTHLAIIPYF